MTPEYRAMAEASVADQAGGGQRLDGGFACKPYGMPRMMNAYSVIELILTLALFSLRYFPIR